MKILVTSLFLIGLTTILPAQNKVYLERVSLENNVQLVEQLQAQIANFDVTTLDAYEKNAKTNYHVTFKNTRAIIEATFNDKGFVVKTIESYKDVKSPLKVRMEISEKHQGWYAESNLLKIKYSKEFEIKKVLEVKIKKGDAVKTLLFDFTKNDDDYLVKN